MNDSLPALAADPLHPDPEIARALEFDPVPRQIERAGGWSPEAQRAFIAGLAATGSPRQAAKAIGLATAGVERLRGLPGAESFSAAWDRAVAVAADQRSGRLRSGVARMIPSAGPMAEAAPHDQVPVIPVVCDRCAAEGIAGDEAFFGIPDILAFDPVPVRHGPWDEQAQRAFIAALAVTGSVGKAARSVGRHAIAAEKLRKVRGARGFAEAWEAALEIARERELARTGDRLLGGSDAPRPYDFDDEEDDASLARQADEARDNMTRKLLICRRLYLAEIADSPGKRAAFEILTELPIDWEKAERGEPQPDEPYAIPNMRKPDMLLTAENGWLAEIVHGPDKKAELRKAVDEFRAAEGFPAVDWDSQ